MNVVLRALRLDCLRFYTDPDITQQQQAFIDKVINNGHAVYCVIRAVHLMLQADPFILEIRHVLDIASVVGVEATNYFLLMLDV